VSDIEKRKTAELTNQADLFEHYGNEATARNITGTLLRFSKGDYLAGTEGEDIPVGTRFIAAMDSLSVGWLRWWDNAPDPQGQMGLVIDGFQPERRSALPDQDKSQWQLDSEGVPRDPWQFTNYLILRRVDDGEIFTFATSSKGGLNAIGELAKEYGKKMRQRPNDWPVVKVDVGSYLHRDRTLGRIKFPIFEIVDWVAKDGPDGKSTPQSLPRTNDSPPKPAAAAKPATRKTSAAAQTQF
jgi:hypothetical protein